MSYGVKFPLGKYASARAAAGVAKATGACRAAHANRGARAEPERPSYLNCGVALLPHRAGFRSFGCAQISFTDKKIYQLNSASLRESRIMRFQANLANTNL